MKWVVNKDGMPRSWRIPTQLPLHHLQPQLPEPAPPSAPVAAAPVSVSVRPFNLGLQQQCRLSSVVGRLSLHTQRALGRATPTGNRTERNAHKCPVMPLWPIMSKASLSAISFCFRPRNACSSAHSIPFHSKNILLVCVL